MQYVLNENMMSYRNIVEGRVYFWLFMNFDNVFQVARTYFVSDILNSRLLFLCHKILISIHLIFYALFSYNFFTIVMKSLHLPFGIVNISRRRG